jgi:ankyrin repeat protein
MHDAVLFSLPDDDDVAAELVALLIEHGADPWAKGKEGLTAIEYSARRGLEQSAETMRGASAKNSSNPHP